MLHTSMKHILETRVDVGEEAMEDPKLTTEKD
jgi:hypothetical protein